MKSTKRFAGFLWITALAVSFCGMALAADSARTDEKPAAVDADQYAVFFEDEVYDLQDLAEGAEIQRRLFNRMTPPGISWLQPMFPSVAPFAATNFDESFLDDLLGEEKNSVAVYPLSLILVPVTRETLIYNAEGKLIATVPADGVSRTWSEDADPARVTLLLDLLPVEDVEPYLYVGDRIAESITSTVAKSKPARNGGFAMKSLGQGEFGFCGVQKLTNGNMRLTVTNGTDVVEVYAYTVLHTSSVVIATWTNEEDEVVTDTNVVWAPVSPPFAGIQSAWESRTTNLVLTNGVAVWEDSNISSNARVRFYGAAKRMDSDADDLTDGAEILLHRTDSGVADTDLDGHSDGREIALETDPLDGGDYFGIVINAALPITNSPANPGEWVELFNAGPSPKSLAGFRLQTAKPAGWTNVFTFPAGTTLDSGDFIVVGTNGDFQAALGMPDSYSNPPAVFGIRLVAPSPSAFVADALLYGFTNVFGFSLDGFGEELPIVRPKITNVIRRTWIGYDSNHAGDWKNTPVSSWLQHTQGDYLDLDGDGLSNGQEIAGGVYPRGAGSRIDEPDTDSDGLNDAAEAANGTDANNADTDGDAFPWDSSAPAHGNDAEELSVGSSPFNGDSDGDGIPDGWELAGGLDPLSIDSDENAMPDGDEDSDTDVIPNKEEVENLTNPFDGEDVDPRPYLWDGDDPGGYINEGDIGYDIVKDYHVLTQPDSQPIVVQVIEGGYMVEVFGVKCDVECFCLNPDDPPTNRFYCIAPEADETNFWFYISDERTTWPNETEPEYGADIQLRHGPTGADLDAGVAEESEESVGFLLADKSAHPEAERRLVQIKNVSGGEYLTNVVLTYDTTHLCVYDSASGGNVIENGAVFPTAEAMPDLYAEGIAHSGMLEAYVAIVGDKIPAHDQVNASVLKADIGSAGPLADRTLHPNAAREPLLLKQTLPDDWNGLMHLSLSGAVAFWTPTGGAAIVLGETAFTNAQLDKTIYLEGDGCGTGQASFAVVGLSDCVTNVPLRIFGANATLDGVAELDEEAPGGFIADRTVHTNASRTALNLAALGPSGSSGNLVLTWNSSLVRIYTAPTGGTALAQFYVPFAGFNGTNLYVEGIFPGVFSLQWSYSGQSDCEDVIQVTVVRLELTNIKFNHNTASSASDAINIRQDYTHEYDISSGEWVKGGTNIPVCYTTNKAVTIKARFTVQPASVTSADIWAVSTDSDGSLDDVIEASITCSGGVSVGDPNGYVELQITGNTPATIKKTATDVWQWKMENINGSGSIACDLNLSGSHTVYTVLNEPATPWVNTVGSQNNAWTKALELAIVSASCNGDSSAPGALSHITQYLHTGHGLTYDTNAGEAAYASSNLGETFQLTEYIEKTGGDNVSPPRADNIVNCYDQAAGVYTLARLLGVSVAYRFMYPFGYINTVNLIGEGNCNNPFYPQSTSGLKIAGADDVDPVRKGFGNHAFTAYGGYVFDACAGPVIGTRTEAQYVSDTIDVSTPAEAAVAGVTSNISYGAVTDIQ
ncbi:MAG: lamin tail domain-containing protein [Kiritimatiellia bacterium]